MHECRGSASRLLQITRERHLQELPKSRVLGTVSTVLRPWPFVELAPTDPFLEMVGLQGHKVFSALTAWDHGARTAGLSRDQAQVQLVPTDAGILIMRNVGLTLLKWDDLRRLRCRRILFVGYIRLDGRNPDGSWVPASFATKRQAARDFVKFVKLQRKIAERRGRQPRS